jgi:hypothetical protein
LPQRIDLGLSRGVAIRLSHQHADPSYPARLLRARCERPRSRSPAEKRDEIAPSHDRPPDQPTLGGGMPMRNE